MYQSSLKICSLSTPRGPSSVFAFWLTPASTGVYYRKEKSPTMWTRTPLTRELTLMRDPRRNCQPCARRRPRRSPIMLLLGQMIIPWQNICKIGVLYSCIKHMCPRERTVSCYGRLATSFGDWYLCQYGHAGRRPSRWHSLVLVLCACMLLLDMIAAVKVR
jgi:hypothetical protein